MFVFIRESEISEKFTNGKCDLATMRWVVFNSAEVLWLSSARRSREAWFCATGILGWGMGVA